MNTLQSFLQNAQPGQFLVVAGRPPAELSRLARTAADQAAVVSNLPTELLIPGGDTHAAVEGILVTRAGVKPDAVATGNLTDADHERIKQAAEVLGRAPLYLDATLDLSLPDLRFRLEPSVREHRIRVLIIDGFHVHASNRPADAMGLRMSSTVSEKLKKMAVELGIIVVAFVRLPLDAAEDGLPVPLAQMPGGKDLEHHADLVLLHEANLPGAR